MLIVVAIFAAVVAMFFAKPEASKGELEAFASKHGETLQCYQNGKRQDVCDFRDSQSKGGSRNLPMQLGAFFVMKDGKVVSHELDTAPPRMQ